MLDTEQTSLGLYLPDATDPDTSQPLAAALWEVALLHRHYHPTVAKLARRVAAGAAGVADRPQAIYRQFDASLGAFVPAVKPPQPQPLAKRPPGTAVCGGPSGRVRGSEGAEDRAGLTVWGDPWRPVRSGVAGREGSLCVRGRSKARRNFSDPWKWPWRR